MQRKIFGNKKTVADIFLIAALLIVSLSVFLFVEFSREEGEFVRVSVDGETVGEYSLKEDGEYKLNGGTNILVIEGGEAYIRWADCPKQLCVNQGRISRTGQRITCLENRVIVEVFGGDDEVLEV